MYIEIDEKVKEEQINLVIKKIIKIDEVRKKVLANPSGHELLVRRVQLLSKLCCDTFKLCLNDIFIQIDFKTTLTLLPVICEWILIIEEEEDQIIFIKHIYNYLYLISCLSPIETDDIPNAPSLNRTELPSPFHTPVSSPTRSSLLSPITPRVQTFFPSYFTSNNYTHQTELAKSGNSIYHKEIEEEIKNGNIEKTISEISDVLCRIINEKNNIDSKILYLIFNLFKLISIISFNFKYTTKFIHSLLQKAKSAVKQKVQQKDDNLYLISNDIIRNIPKDMVSDSDVDSPRVIIKEKIFPNESDDNWDDWSDEEVTDTFIHDTKQYFKEMKKLFPNSKDNLYLESYK